MVVMSRNVVMMDRGINGVDDHDNHAFLIFSKVMTVLPICTPCLIRDNSISNLSYLTSVPNLDLLSKI